MKSSSSETDRWAPMLPDWLAYLYKPLLPYLENIHIHRAGARDYNPADILLPEGYTAEVVATGFNAPVHCCFDDDGYCYVVESGHKIEAPPRILRVDPQTGAYTTVFTLPEDRGIKEGALTGAQWVDGSLYVMNTDTLARLTPDGNLEDLVTGLPGKGDHQANHPLLGPDGKLYFGVGSQTNCGVVGADNYAFEWLPKHPDLHDLPAEDIVLAGRNYAYQNVLGDIRETVHSGAYVPFGTPTEPGQVIAGAVKCTGSVLRCNPDGSDLEVVAWGLRNPYGVAFHPDGRLFATEHGMDERGRRYILDDPDDFYQIEEGAWYGWPDFASGIRLDDPHWGSGGHGRAPVLAEFPDPNPPKPVASFETHAAANGFDFSRDARFGFQGQAFVACFGDLAPITTVTDAFTPAGFKVVRVDPQSGQVFDFAVNKIAGPASGLPHAGFERPSHCQFGPDGSLYVVDFGKIRLAPEKGGIRQQLWTGSLWRIRRTEGPKGILPPKAKVLPVYLMEYLAIA
ncbi:MAG TPA: PQQ-dependent sugar dehydrogenase, partial [Desulfosarcina sp.]|nr:PQQ-dependent sugar dehydrogenase [Desulfosarcina sp.]